MTQIDTVVVAVYIVGTTLFGCSFMFRKGLGNADGFMTGGGRLPTWTVALSIFATHVSSIAFLGLPAKAFLSNWNPYVMSLTVPLAAIVAAMWFVPFYRSHGGVSAYSFLEARYGAWARLYASACFLSMQTMRSGFILFLMAILTNALFGWSVPVVIAATGLATAVYSMAGGLSAVVWTDAVQSIILIVGTVVCIAVLGFSMPDASEAFSAASAAGKFSLGGFSPFDWSVETFWVIFVYGMFVNLQNFGIDQSFTQRYIAAKTESAAKKSLLSSALMYLVNTAFFVFIGTLLWMYAQTHPGVVPAGVLEKPDAVFPWFIVNKLPVGVSGLMVAAIIAAAMSTVSTTLNSGATVLLEDYRRRFFPNAGGGRGDILFLRAATAVLGIVSVLVGISVMNVHSALSAFWELQSVLSGGMLGLFLLALLSRKSKGVHAAVATVVALLVVVWVMFGQELTGLSLRLHVDMAIVLGTVSLVAVGAAASASFRRNGSVCSAVSQRKGEEWK